MDSLASLKQPLGVSCPSINNLELPPILTKPLHADNIPNAVGMQQPQPSDLANDLLIKRLLEQLDVLSKVNGSKTPTSIIEAASVGGSSSGRSTEINQPSSPTGVGQFDFSPAETISREHSTDCLVMAVQQLSLQAKPAAPRAYSPSRHHTPPPPPQHHQIPPASYNPSTWNSHAAAPTTAPGSIPYNQLLIDAAAGHTLRQQALNIPPAAATNMMPYPQRQSQLLDEHLNSFYKPAPVLNHQNMPPPMMEYADPRYAHLLNQQNIPEEILVGLNGQYQPYVDQIISDDLNAVAFQLLMRVKVLQLADTPMYSHLYGKRYFCSLKEVSKVVPYAKDLIIAPDVRPSPTAHIKPVGLLASVVRAAEMAGVPYVFALSRRGIGQVFGRDKNMSIVAVMNTDGVEEEFQQMIRHRELGAELFKLHFGTARRF